MYLLKHDGGAFYWLLLCCLMVSFGSLMMIGGSQAVQPSYSTRSYILAGGLPENVNASEVNVCPKPFSLFMDHIDNVLYFVEKGRIRKITLTTGLVSTVVCLVDCLIITTCRLVMVI